jgi:hypothetical protein
MRKAGGRKQKAGSRLVVKNMDVSNCCENLSSLTIIN